MKATVNSILFTIAVNAQPSILALLLFLTYVNNLLDISRSLDPIMFVDDTILFYLNCDKNTLFPIVNEELETLGDWFAVNEL